MKMHLKKMLTESMKFYKKNTQMDSLNKPSDKEEKEDKEQSNNHNITSYYEQKNIRRHIMCTTRPATKEIKIKRK